MRISSADDRTIMTRLANQVKNAASSRELTDVHGTGYVHMHSWSRDGHHVSFTSHPAPTPTWKCLGAWVPDCCSRRAGARTLRSSRRGEGPTRARRAHAYR